jgi:transglutaminase-like putative cysteine protease
VRYRVRHITTYAYTEPVTLSQNLAHLAIRGSAHQQVSEARIDIDPPPAVVRRRSDYFGNPTDAFTIASQHSRLVVSSQSVVEVTAPITPDPMSTPSWDDSSVQGGGSDLAAAEYRYDSAQIPCAAVLRAYAQPDFTPGRPVLAAALAFNARINREFVYDPAATNVSTPVLDALDLRRGVCQDFAQVLIGSLRTLGLCARYVSGYLETTPPPGRPRLVGADATHAWAQVWCGPHAGWIDLDPTNACIPGERHILVAIGRDFADVSPLKGMVLGGGQAEVTVGVDVERIS